MSDEVNYLQIIAYHWWNESTRKLKDQRLLQVKGVCTTHRIVRSSYKRYSRINRTRDWPKRFLNATQDSNERESCWNLNGKRNQLRLVIRVGYRDLLRKIAPNPRTRIQPFFGKKTGKRECFFWREIVLNGRGILKMIKVSYETKKQFLMLFVEIDPGEWWAVSVLARNIINRPHKP